MAIFRGALPADDFAIVSNHWFRDPRVSGKAKGYMGYIATHSPQYRLTVEQLIAEMKDGKDAVYAGLEELVTYGYLTRVQATGERGQFGEVDYHFGPAAIEMQYARSWPRKAGTGAAKGKPAGQTASGKSGSGPDQAKQGVSAGETASGFPGSGKPASGKSDTKKDQGLEVEGLEESKENPPTPAAAEPAAADSVGAVTGGDSLAEQTRKTLNDAVVGAVEVRAGAAGWTVKGVRTSVRSALAAGHSVDLVVNALADLATDLEGTRWPGRLTAYLDAKARQADQGPPPWAVPSIAYVEPGRRRCPDHRDYPADNCAQHRKDAEIAALEADRGDVTAAAAPATAATAAAELAATRALLANRAPRVAAQRGKPAPSATSTAPDVDRAEQLARLAELADAV